MNVCPLQQIIAAQMHLARTPLGLIFVHAMADSAEMDSLVQILMNAPKERANAPWKRPAPTPQAPTIALA